MKQKWEKELDDWGQKFGNMFAGFLGMFFDIEALIKPIIINFKI